MSCYSCHQPLHEKHNRVTINGKPYSFCGKDLICDEVALGVCYFCNKNEQLYIISYQNHNIFICSECVGTVKIPCTRCRSEKKWKEYKRCSECWYVYCSNCYPEVLFLLDLEDHHRDVCKSCLQEVLNFEIDMLGSRIERWKMAQRANKQRRLSSPLPFIGGSDYQASEQDEIDVTKIKLSRYIRKLHDLKNDSKDQFMF